MPDYLSEAPTPELAAAFPARIPDPEALVYSYVKAAAGHGQPAGRPALSFYEDNARAVAEGKLIRVGRGWPAYNPDDPSVGQVPQIGVGSGTESQDQAQKVIQGGFVGEARHVDANGNLLGLADYYAFPLYVPITVILIHENRDERDRLHNQLRRVMAPLTTWLPRQDAQIKAVSVDGEKDEVASEGPTPDSAPFLIYTSVFTAHVYCEMLEPANIVDATAIATGFEVIPSTPVTASFEMAFESGAD